MKTRDELEGMKKSDLIDLIMNNELLPIVKNAPALTFSALGYVEDVVQALADCKVANGNAWKSGSKLLDVKVDNHNDVHLILKVHGIDTHPLVQTQVLDDVSRLTKMAVER
jgi:hypothetical protein